MKWTYSLLICLLIVHHVYSSGVRGGEINYSHLSGFTFQFNVTILSNDSAVGFIVLSYGDGTIDTLLNSGITVNGNSVSNEYSATHTFSGTGIYIVSTEVNYLMNDIANIQNIADQPFYSEDTLQILDPQFYGFNSSTLLLNAPVIFGEASHILTYQPNMFDPDGDSISFSLVSFFASEYSFPDAANSIVIDAITGQFTWNEPTAIGNYAIAILIKEYRFGQLIGTELAETVITITDSTLAIVEPVNNMIFSIFPNPVKDFLNISASNDNSVIVEILSSAGQIFLIEPYPGERILDLSFLSSGIYYLVIRKKNLSASVSFVKL